METLELDLENEGGDSDGNAKEEEWDGFEEDDFPAGNEYGLKDFIHKEEGEEEGEGEGVMDPDVSNLSLGNFTEFISSKEYAVKIKRKDRVMEERYKEITRRKEQNDKRRMNVN